jgi:hypothetical protein
MFGFAKNSYLLSTHCSLESIIIDARNLLRLCGLCADHYRVSSKQEFNERKSRGKRAECQACLTLLTYRSLRTKNQSLVRQLRQV